MANEKVSEFAGRRGAPGTVPAQSATPRPGAFDRNPCGECWHWKPYPRAGLNMGKCMAGPPLSVPVAQGGGAGAILSRPIMPDTYEGCDQWDDEPEFIEGDGEPDGAQLAAAGE